MASASEHTGRHKAVNGKPVWLLLALALTAPLVYGLLAFGFMRGQLSAQEKDIAKNATAIGATSRIYVPRTEIDAKLETIQVQIGSVQANVDDLKDQGERQTAEIIRRIERIDSPRRVQ